MGGLMSGGFDEWGDLMNWGEGEGVLSPKLDEPRTYFAGTWQKSIFLKDMFN